MKLGLFVIVFFAQFSFAADKVYIAAVAETDPCHDSFTVTLTYSGANPIALALVILPDPVAAVTEYQVGSTDSWFDLFPDYAFGKDPFPICSGLCEGSPLANPNQAGAAILPLGFGRPVSVCVAHLQGRCGGTRKIAKIKFKTVGNPDQFTYSVMLDQLRGGVVNENGPMEVILPQPLMILYGPNELLKSPRIFNYNGPGPAYTLTITDTQVDRWKILGCPKCWLCLAQKVGNIVTTNGNANVSTADLAAFRASYGKFYTQVGYNPCADSNLDGTISTNDLARFRAHYGLTVGGCP